MGRHRAPGRWLPGRKRSADTPDASSSAEAVDPSDQAEERAETTIAEGPLADWDVRWDETGTRLAVWVADAEDPTVGTLSLYVVDPFDGRSILRTRRSRTSRRSPGFSIADGRLAWAAPPAIRATPRAAS